MAEKLEPVTLEFTDSDFSSGDNPISQYVERYSGRNIETLKLKLVLGLVSDPVVQESIRIALENKVRTLDLYLCDYVVGEVVFSGESIVNLHLSECELGTLSVDQIRCPNLKTLSLCMVSLVELMFENILCGCPSLEELKVSLCGGRDMEEDENRDGDDFDLLHVKKHLNLRVVDVELHTLQTFVLGELPRLELLCYQ